MTGVAAIFVDKFGRKPLLLLSKLDTYESFFALGVFNIKAHSNLGRYLCCGEDTCEAKSCNGLYSLYLFTEGFVSQIPFKVSFCCIL